MGMEDVLVRMVYSNGWKRSQPGQYESMKGGGAGHNSMQQWKEEELVRTVFSNGTKRS
jgi:hypothetical protein